MSFILLANIGNSDLIVSDNHLPASQQAGARWTTRSIGEELQTNLAQYAEHIELPLLAPTLRWLLANHPVLDNAPRIYLFASDQPQQLTSENARQKDTMPIAKVIQTLLTDAKQCKRLLGQSINLGKKHIMLNAIDGNPADYANMLAFYNHQLPMIAQTVPNDMPIYLEISGGTPAMTAMLIVTSVEIFGQRAHTLYLDRGAIHPYEVAVADELFARHAHNILKTQIEMHAYAVALRTLGEYKELIISDLRRRSLTEALLLYADRRLAFDFEQAISALQGARRLTVGNDQVTIQYWLTELTNANIRVNLAELLYSIQIKNSFGDYADLVQRVFRFQEATFRYLAEQMGLVYSSSNTDEYLDSAWLKTNPDLSYFVQNYLIPGSTQRIAVDLGRSLNRVSLGAIVDYFIQQGSNWQYLQGIVNKLHRLSKVAELRNKGLSGHGFRGISSEMIQKAYGGSLVELLDELNMIYNEIFKAAKHPNPYSAINQFLLRLLAK